MSRSPTEVDPQSREELKRSVFGTLVMWEIGLNMDSDYSTANLHEYFLLIVPHT